jgi:hypothetical protein
MAATLSGGGIFFVECMGCHVRTGKKESYDDALAAWNRRHGGATGKIQKIIELAEEDRGSYALDRLERIAELARAALTADDEVSRLKVEVARLQSLVETKDRLIDMVTRDHKNLTGVMLQQGLPLDDQTGPVQEDFL